MNRELKFRVWHKKRNKYIQNWSFDIIKGADCNNGYIGFISSDNESGLLLKLEDYLPKDIIIQQFTGLLDKNKKEIYEGDIIQTVYNDNSRGKIGEVKWISKADKWDYSGWYSYPAELPFGVENNPTEIIGNIFENPELIK